MYKHDTTLKIAFEAFFFTILIPDPLMEAAVSINAVSSKFSGLA
jgi:hypothetical protein